MENTEEKFIEELKAKHGQIYLIEFEDGKKAYLKKPSRNVLSMAMTKMQSNPLGFAETILNQCFVAGDEEVKTSDEYFLGAAGQLERTSYGGEKCRTKKVIEDSKGDLESNWIGYVNTMLEYYLGINPQTLTDDEWAEKFAQLQNIREQEAKTNGFSG